jgi:meso-butanediol dehydrogenase/(S,S)-butanediol dehydrogenase/diacetyl reductase
VVIAGRNGPKAEAIAQVLRSEGKEALGLAADVSRREEVRGLVEKTVHTFGEINVIFNNAGINKPMSFLETDEENFETIMRVNALGVFMGMQEAGRQMIAQDKGGKIINTSSIAGRQGYANIASYCASKAAVISLTQAGAREFAKHRITVNAIAPGIVVTPLWDHLEQDMLDKGVTKQRGEWMERFMKDVLLQRPSVPRDFAGLSVFLASEESDYFTGQTFVMDGGMLLL